MSTDYLTVKTKVVNKDGQRHRVDGPAVEYANGIQEWWLNDKLHRTDGPAITFANGNKWWYQNGILHREDGPAIERSHDDGNHDFYIKGRKISEFILIEGKIHYPMSCCDKCMPSAHLIYK